MTTLEIDYGYCAHCAARCALNPDGTVAPHFTGHTLNGEPCAGAGLYSNGESIADRKPAPYVPTVEGDPSGFYLAEAKAHLAAADADPSGPAATGRLLAAAACANIAVVHQIGRLHDDLAWQLQQIRENQS